MQRFRRLQIGSVNFHQNSLKKWFPFFWLQTTSSHITQRMKHTKEIFRSSIILTRTCPPYLFQAHTNPSSLSIYQSPCVCVFFLFLPMLYFLCLLIYLSINLSIYLSIYLSVYVLFHLSTYALLFLSFNLSL